VHTTCVAQNLEGMQGFGASEGVAHKANELYVHWLATSEAQQLCSTLLRDLTPPPAGALAQAAVSARAQSKRAVEVSADGSRWRDGDENIPPSVKELELAVSAPAPDAAISPATERVVSPRPHRLRLHGWPDTPNSPEGEARSPRSPRPPSSPLSTRKRDGSPGRSPVRKAAVEVDVGGLAPPTATSACASPHKRRIECCSSDAAAAEMLTITARATGAMAIDEGERTAQRSKRAAVARLPMLTLRWSANGHVQRAQQADLERMLHAHGLHAASTISAAELAALLPMLPGGGIPGSLCLALANKLRRLQLAHTPVGEASDIAVGALRAFFSQRMAGLPAEARLFPCLADEERGAVRPEDLGYVVRQVLDTHPALQFLGDAVEFQDKYAHTVIVRICYEADPRRSGMIREQDLRTCSLLSALQELEGGAAADDINAERRYFSYEHFYVIFCTFCNLDEDQDGQLSVHELLRYGDFALSQRLVQRIFDCRRDARASNGLDYEDFIWFLLSEEHKCSRTACAYWFRILDLDADGRISAADMEYFYEEQAQRQFRLSQEAVPFANVLTQLQDAMRPRDRSRSAFTLADVRRSGLCSLLVHTLGNINKFLMGELSDPNVARDDKGAPALSMWDRWAAVEYGRLAAEDDTDGSDVSDTDDMDEDEPDEFGPGGGARGNGGLRSAGGAAESPF